MRQKTNRGGARPGAGRPAKNGKRTNVKLTDQTRQQLINIHPILTKAIEIAADYYHEQKKLS